MRKGMSCLLLGMEKGEGFNEEDKKLIRRY